ncbi:hypothetical protein Tco_1378562 [Tanacetum coccineum]
MIMMSWWRTCEDVDEEEAEAFNLIANNFSKFFRKNNIFRHDNQFGNRANRFERGRGNGFGNKGGDNSKQQICLGSVVDNLTLWHRRLAHANMRSQGYSQTSKAYIVLNKETMRIEESLNVTFDESLPEPKLSPLVEDDRINEPVVQDLNGSVLLQVNVSDKGYLKSVKEARGHPIEQVIGEMNERILRSKAKQA